MKAIVFLESDGNSNNCILIYKNVRVVKVCSSAQDCLYLRGKSYINGCGSIIIDGDHLEAPVKVEIIP